MRIGLGIGCALAVVALAQAPANNAAIGGIVKDAGTGQPIAGYVVSTMVNAAWANNTVSTGKSTKDVTSTTDNQGRYRLGDLPPGDYRVMARAGQHFSGVQMKQVTLAGSDLENVDFTVMVPGTISGQVVDENREPMPDIRIYLVSREYFQGSLGYFLKGAATTDDRGRYTLTGAEAGRAYLILADRIENRLPARSDAPLNPKLRRPVPTRTWYPNSPMAEGAMPVTLRSGERREWVDIQIGKSASYCLEGVLTTPNGPTALGFTIEAQRPSSGASSSGGMFMATPFGLTGPDGKFRICGLAPGTYRLSTLKTDPQTAPLYGVAAVTIADRDLRNLQLAASPGEPLEGEVVWDGAAPNGPVSAKLSLWFQPCLRAFYQGEETSARADIPGAFSFPSLFMDSYHVQPSVNGAGLYVKDITYSGRSVFHEPLQLGSAMGGAGLRVIVGHDGGSVSVRVTDKDGNPVSDAHIVVMPREIASPAMLADTLVFGQTSQLGVYTSQPLAPGTYLALATGEAFDATPESIDKLWRSRNRFTEVEVAPNGAAQLTLQPVAIE